MVWGSKGASGTPGAEGTGWWGRAWGGRRKERTGPWRQVAAEGSCAAASQGTQLSAFTTKRTWKGWKGLASEATPKSAFSEGQASRAAPWALSPHIFLPILFALSFCLRAVWSQQEEGQGAGAGARAQGQGERSVLWFGGRSLLSAALRSLFILKQDWEPTRLSGPPQAQPPEWPPSMLSQDPGQLYSCTKT